jgi:hypothetical protein
VTAAPDGIGLDGDSCRPTPLYQKSGLGPAYSYCEKAVVFILAFITASCSAGTWPMKSSAGQDFIGVCVKNELSVPGVLGISQNYFNHGHDVIGVGGGSFCERNNVRIPQSH